MWTCVGLWAEFLAWEQFHSWPDLRGTSAVEYSHALCSVNFWAKFGPGGLTKVGDLRLQRGTALWKMCHSIYTVRNIPSSVRHMQASLMNERRR